MKTTFTYIIGLLLISITALCMLSLDMPFLNQLSEYTVHIMFFNLFLGLIFLLTNKPKLLAVSFMCTAAIAIFLKDASNEDLKYPEQNVLYSMGISHFNLSNVDYNLEDVIKIIDREDPDIITFQEYTPEWTSILSQKIKNRFVHSQSEVRIDPFGMAIFSKYPLIESEIYNYNNIPNLKFGINLNDTRINIFLSYVLPPVLNQKMQTTSAHLNLIGESIIEGSSPSIVLGDFNMVYWKNEISTFRNKFNLKNSRKEFTSLGLSIPYDHMFFTSELECTTLKDLSNSKGEHIGIYGVFQYSSKSTLGEQSIGFSR